MKPFTIAILAVSAGLIATAFGILWGLPYGILALGIGLILLVITVEMN